MTVFQGIALGLLQGFAEFLPISSSGHLAVAKRLFGLGDLPMLYDVLLHVATLAAVVIVFRKRIGELFAALWRWLRRISRPEDGENLRFILAVLVGTLITGIIGIAIERLNPGDNLKLVSAGFMATAVILIVAERIGARRAATARAATARATKGPGPREGLIVGIAQGIGVLPGVSRSGITISASLGAGIDRGKAGEFSFILSIPAVLGAMLLELKDAGSLFENASALPLALGLVVAFASGLLAIRLLLGLIKRAKLSWFAIYLVPLGLAGLLFL